MKLWLLLKTWHKHKDIVVLDRQTYQALCSNIGAHNHCFIKPLYPNEPAAAFGFAKDPFALKPLLVTETDNFVAIATEEIAIRAAFADDGNGQPYQVREAQAKEVRVWQR